MTTENTLLSQLTSGAHQVSPKEPNLMLSRHRNPRNLPPIFTKDTDGGHQVTPSSRCKQGELRGLVWCRRFDQVNVDLGHGRTAAVVRLRDASGEIWLSFKQLHDLLPLVARQSLLNALHKAGNQFCLWWEERGGCL